MNQHSPLATSLTWAAIAATATGFTFQPTQSTVTPDVASGSDFDKAVAFIFDVEGGLSDHPNDAGGRTNMGITKARAEQHGLTPDEITKEKATEIYRTDYWDRAGCGEFEWPLSLACLNTAVNSGVGKAQEFNGMIGDGDVREEAIAYAQRQEDYYRDVRFVSAKREAA